MNGIEIRFALCEWNSYLESIGCILQDRNMSRKRGLIWVDDLERPAMDGIKNLWSRKEIGVPKDLALKILLLGEPPMLKLDE